jgi:hypothetical protein
MAIFGVLRWVPADKGLEIAPFSGPAVPILCFLKGTGRTLTGLLFLSGCSFLKLSTTHSTSNVSSLLRSLCRADLDGSESIPLKLVLPLVVAGPTVQDEHGTRQWSAFVY